jgi:hypothetical protein
MEREARARAAVMDSRDRAEARAPMTDVELIMIAATIALVALVVLVGLAVLDDDD